MNAGGSSLLRYAGNELLHLFPNDHHHIGEFIDHHDDRRERFQRRCFGHIAFKDHLRGFPERIL